MTASVLIVNDERGSLGPVSAALKSRGILVYTCDDEGDASAAVASVDPDVVLIGPQIPDATGLELVDDLRRQNPRTHFVFVTERASIRSAVEAFRRGVTDYLVEPLDVDEVLLTMRRLLDQQAMRSEIEVLRFQQRVATGLHRQPASYPSPSMAAVMERARRVAQQDGNVVFLGESGTGKDRLARWVHEHSRRKEGPYFAINCGALASELADSELFGHEPGAYTGSRGRKRGMLELAQRGTLLLNEIGELDLQLQTRLLTFLDTRTLLRVGGERPISVDTRVLAATNRNLEEEVAKGRFRKDLYYRLNVVAIEMPPLRERLEDLPVLVGELLDDLAQSMVLERRPMVCHKAMDAMRQYPWPGNIRELRNMLERGLMLTGRTELCVDDLGLRDRSPGWQMTVRLDGAVDLRNVVNDVIRRLITEALRRSETKIEAARLLGLTRHSLAHYQKALDIPD